MLMNPSVELMVLNLDTCFCTNASTNINNKIAENHKPRTQFFPVNIFVIKTTECTITIAQLQCVYSIILTRS